MKLTILPNWCKWLSLALLISSFRVDYNNLIDAFLRGYDSQAMLMANTETIPVRKSSDNSGTYPLPDLLILLSVVVYILSKDKRDDEFINSIRAQALLAAFLVTSITMMFIYAFNGRLDGSYLILIQLLSYVIIFKFMKIRADIVGVID